MCALLAVTATKGVAKVLPEINLDILTLVPNLEQVLWNVLTTNISLAAVEAEPVCAHDEVAVLTGVLTPAVLNAPLLSLTVLIQLNALEGHCVGKGSLIVLNH